MVRRASRHALLSYPAQDAIGELAALGVAPAGIANALREDGYTKAGRRITEWDVRREMRRQEGLRSASS